MAAFDEFARDISIARKALRNNSVAVEPLRSAIACCAIPNRNASDLAARQNSELTGCIAATGPIQFGRIDPAEAHPDTSMITFAAAAGKPASK